MIRRLIVLLVVVGVLAGAALIVGELIAEPAVERRIAQEIQDRYGLAERPDVDIDAFPFLVAAGRGDLDKVEVDADNVLFEGLTVDRVELDLIHLRYSVSDVLRDREAARADEVSGLAVVSQAALNQYLLDRGIPLTVTLTPGQVTVAGTVVVGGQPVAGSATGALSVVNGTLQFVPTAVDIPGFSGDPAGLGEAIQQLGFAVPVPAVVGVTLTGVTVDEGQARLTAAAVDYQVMG